MQRWAQTGLTGKQLLWNVSNAVVLVMAIASRSNKMISVQQTDICQTRNASDWRTDPRSRPPGDIRQRMTLICRHLQSILFLPVFICHLKSHSSHVFWNNMNKCKHTQLSFPDTWHRRRRSSQTSTRHGRWYGG